VKCSPVQEAIVDGSDAQVVRRRSAYSEQARGCGVEGGWDTNGG
jgi:hypothetical protein